MKPRNRVILALVVAILAGLAARLACAGEPPPEPPTEEARRRPLRRVEPAPDAGTPRAFAVPPNVFRALRPDAGTPPPDESADGGVAAPEDGGVAGEERRRLVLRGKPLLDRAGPTGTLPKEAIRSSIRAVQPALKDCYEQGLRQDPFLGGDAVLSFTIEAREGDGRIVDAEVVEDRTTMADVLVQACLLDALSKARFPVPGGDGQVRVTYPFRFASADAGTPEP